MNLPDDLQARRQQAIEQAMEMYTRAQKKAQSAAMAAEAPADMTPPPQIEVEVVDEPFGSRSLNYTDEIIDLPAEPQNANEELPPLREGEELFPQLDQELEDTPREEYDWEGLPKDNWKEGFSFREHEEPTPSKGSDRLPATQSNGTTNTGQSAERNHQTPTDETTPPPQTTGNTVPDDDEETRCPDDDGRPGEGTNPHTSNTQRASAPETSTDGWSETDGYTEQYDGGPAIPAQTQNQRRAVPPTDHPIYDHEEDRPTTTQTRATRGLPANDPVTRDQPWTDTEGYTEQYYENEDTYEEFSNGHSEEQADSVDAVPASTTKRRRTQRDKVRQNDIRYGNFKHQDQWKQKEPPRQQKPPKKPQQQQNQLGDDAILWLLLMNLMEEENKNTELIMALMYLLMG